MSQALSLPSARVWWSVAGLSLCVSLLCSPALAQEPAPGPGPTRNAATSFEQLQDELPRLVKPFAPPIWAWLQGDPTRASSECEALAAQAKSNPDTMLATCHTVIAVYAIQTAPTSAEASKAVDLWFARSQRQLSQFAPAVAGAWLERQEPRRAAEVLQRAGPYEEYFLNEFMYERDREQLARIFHAANMREEGLAFFARSETRAGWSTSVYLLQLFGDRPGLRAQVKAEADKRPVPFRREPRLLQCLLTTYGGERDAAPPDKAERQRCAKQLLGETAVMCLVGRALQDTAMQFPPTATLRKDAAYAQLAGIDRASVDEALALYERWRNTPAARSWLKSPQRESEQERAFGSSVDKELCPAALHRLSRFLPTSDAPVEVPETSDWSMANAEASLAAEWIHRQASRVLGEDIRRACKDFAQGQGQKLVPRERKQLEKQVENTCGTGDPSKALKQEEPARIEVPKTAEGLPDLSKYPPTEEGARQLLENFLLPDADLAGLTKQLFPTSADFQAIFEGEAASQAEAYYAPLWADPRMVITRGASEYTELLLDSETTEDLRETALKSGGGRDPLADRLKPGVTLYSWKFVKPGEKSGMAYHGLIPVNGRWVFLFKPRKIFKD
jgi:hypothetical protein